MTSVTDQTDVVKGDVAKAERSRFVQQVRAGWIDEVTKFATNLDTDRLEVLRDLAEGFQNCMRGGNRATEGLSRLQQALEDAAMDKGCMMDGDLYDLAADRAAGCLEILPAARRLVAEADAQAE